MLYLWDKFRMNYCFLAFLLACLLAGWRWNKNPSQRENSSSNIAPILRFLLLGIGTLAFRRAQPGMGFPVTAVMRKVTKSGYTLALFNSTLRIHF